MKLEDGNICDHISDPIDSDMTMNVITACLICPLAVIFAIHFNLLLWAKLRSQSTNTVKDPLVPMVIVFNTLTGVCAINILWLFVFEVMRQTHQSVSLTYCATFDFQTWILYVSQYICMQRILVSRLDFVFADSLVSIPNWILRSFNVLHVFSFVTVLIAVSIRAAHSCLYQFHNTGIFVKLDLIAHYSVWCDTNQNYSFVQPTVAIGGGSVIVFGNGFLLYLYVSRLRKALFLGDASSRETVRKSALIAIASIATTLLSVIGIINGILVLPAVDFFLNMLLLYMLYNFGHKWFDRLFGPCFWFVDSWLPLNESVSSERDGQVSPTELSFASDFASKRRSTTAIYSLRMSHPSFRQPSAGIHCGPPIMEMSPSPIGRISVSTNSNVSSGKDDTPVAPRSWSKLTDLVRMGDLQMNVEREQDTPTNTPTTNNLTP